MNATQYDIVNRFLLMGVNPAKIAKEFGAKLTDVFGVQQSTGYKDFVEKKDSAKTDFMNDMFGAMGL
jgi:hypothetical protein